MTVRTYVAILAHTYRAINPHTVRLGRRGHGVGTTGTSGCKVKYYKGLGTSSSKEAREIFSTLDEHQITLSLDERAPRVLAKFYNEECVHERKEMLTVNYEPDSAVDYTQQDCDISTFMLHEHVHFSFYSLFRALPSALDGLTPSRRKALWFFLQTPRASEIKVAQAASGVAQKTMYLHGENSLVETIVGLAQDYAHLHVLIFS